MESPRRNLGLVSIVIGAVALAHCGDDGGGGVHGPVFGADGGGGVGEGGVLGDGAPGGDDGGPTGDGGGGGTDGGGGGEGGPQPGCTEKAAVVGGGATTAFVATSTGLLAWTAQPQTGSVAALPAAAPHGAGFVGAWVAGDGFVRSSVAGLAAVSGRSTVSLVPLGASVHLLYQGADFKFWHGTLASTWDAANDPVGGAGAAQSFGPSAPTAAVAGGKLVVAQVGSNDKVYAQTLDGTWQAAVDTGATGNKDVPPRIIGMSGGTAELMIVFVTPGQFKLTSVTRSANVWSTSTVQVDPNAYTSEPFTLAPLGNGRALLAWRGGDGKAYASVYTAPAWSAPAAIGVAGAAPSIESAPGLAPGICGTDAVAAYAETGGSVKVTTLTGSTWSSPIAVTGTSAAKYVAISTRP